MNPFNFAPMIGNYEQRKVANYHNAETGLHVSTAAVMDGRKPFETAVAHPRYNGGKWIIVEAYATKEQSARGHDRWVKIMTEPNLPPELIDCNNSGLARFINSLEPMVFPLAPDQTKTFTE